MTTLEQWVGSKTYRLGDTGTIVKQIQLGLRGLGYALNGTGYFGPATDTAVEAFQRKAGLTVDGIVGAKTARAIDAASIQGGKLILPTMSIPLLEVSRPLWVEVGMKLLGTREGSGSSDNRTIIQWAKDEGGSIEKAYTHDSIPWCALFENHLFTKVGLKGTETLWALDFAGKWPSVQLHGPCVGAVAPMLRDGGGHVTTIVGRDQHGNLMGLGGNQSDAVTIAAFATTRLNKGFWWPSSVPVPNHQGIDSLPIISSSGKISTKEA